MGRVLAVFAVAVLASVSSGESKRAVRVDPGKIVPKGSQVVFVEAGQPGPGAKGHKPVNTIADFANSVGLTGGPYDVWITPKSGKSIRIAEKWTPKRDSDTIDLASLVGVIYVRGDDLPRVESIVVTPLKDPGPDEKGHVAIQATGDYKEDMLVPVGTYEVWIKPANGARPQRIVDNVRVQNGRMTEVPER